MRLEKLSYLFPMLTMLCACSTPAISSSIAESSSFSSESSLVESSSSIEETTSTWEKSALDNPALRDLYHADKRDTVISSGNQKILVLPIEFKGFLYNDEVLDQLNRCLSGDGRDDTEYWESLSSFYKKSSYGKLNLSFEIASPYLAQDEQGNALTPKEVYEMNGPTATSMGDHGLKLIQSAYYSYLDSHGEQALQDLDQDKNGLVDGVIAVYACPDAGTGKYTFDQTGYYWAFTSWAGSIASMVDGLDFVTPSLECPGVDVFMWASIDFIYDSSYVLRHPGAVDPHTFIHEFGHMLGLDDYYPNGTTFSPLGGLDMMDLNIQDHNCFSKSLLGWCDPYVFDAEEEDVITLRPFESSGDCILIPSSSWNGTSYDEYLMIDFYTPTGLNQLDAEYALNWQRPKGYQNPGVRIFHVDARVMKYKYTQLGIESEYVSSFEDLGDPNYGYRFGASNCVKGQGLGDDAFSLVHMMESSGKNTFISGKTATDESLFHEGDHFMIYSYQSFFPNKKLLNNGDTFLYSIFVEKINEEGARIAIEKIG